MNNINSIKYNINGHSVEGYIKQPNGIPEQDLSPKIQNKLNNKFSLMLEGDTLVFTSAIIDAEEVDF